MGRNKGLLGIKVYTLRMRQLLFGGGEFSGLHLGEGLGLCGAALVGTLCLSLSPRMGDAGTRAGGNTVAHAKLSRTINPKLFEVSLPRDIGKKRNYWTCLVVQWLRIHLPIHLPTQVSSLVQGRVLMPQGN